jgi:endonuclease YncB( thermonuclease family)
VLAYRRYSADYVAAEEIAQSRQTGLWQGEFVPSWEWRQNGRWSDE